MIDTYIPDKVTRRSGKKFGFVRSKSGEDRDKAIQATHGKVSWGNLVSANWVKIQKRNHQEHSNRINHSKRIWVPKHKTVDDTTFVGQEDVRLNGGKCCSKFFDVVADSCENIIENGTTHTPVNIQNHPNEECGEHNTCSDDSKAISHCAGTRNSHPTFIGKLPTQKSLIEVAFLVGPQRTMLTSLSTLLLALLLCQGSQLPI